MYPVSKSGINCALNSCRLRESHSSKTKRKVKQRCAKFKTYKKKSLRGTTRNMIKKTGLNESLCFFEKEKSVFLAEICHCDEKECRVEGRQKTSRSKTFCYIALPFPACPYTHPCRVPWRLRLLNTFRVSDPSRLSSWQVRGNQHHPRAQQTLILLFSSHRTDSLAS